MHKIYNQLISAATLLLLTALPVFGFGNSSMSMTESAEPAISSEMTALTIAIRQPETGEVLQVPLFSENYAQLPVASVNDEPITLKDFSLELAEMHSSMSATEKPDSQSFDKILDRLISVKLAKQEALNIGFDRTPVVQKQIETFTLKTMIQRLLAEQIQDIKVPASEVDALYQQMAIEAKLLTYSFTDKSNAEALLEAYHAGGDFKQLADKMVASGKAEGGEEPKFTKLNDLFPAVAKTVYEMKKGDVSEIFKAEKGFYVFQLEKQQVYENPEVRLAAANRLMQQKSQKTQLEYLESLIDKYVVFDEDAEESLDFVKISAKNPQIKGTEVFSQLSNDKRPLATVSNGKETVIISVAEIAKKVEESMYHGADRVIDGESLNGEKKSAIWNALVAVTGRMEAQSKGIDKTPDFLEKVKKLEESLLFDSFIAKAVVPGVTVPEEAAKKYYYNHLEDYSSPLMLKMKSLIFTNEAAAREAVKRLQADNDFKWVSANTEGLADADNKGILNLGGNLLAASSLPADLQQQLSNPQVGNVIFYAGPNDLYYTLVVDSVFEPKAKTYQEVRQEVGKIIYAQKIKEALNDWVSKLKEAYETKIFIVQDKL